MEVSVLSGVVGAIVGAAIAAVATVFATMLTERYRRRAEVEKRQRDMDLARQRRLEIESAKDVGFHKEEAIRWLSFASGVRQVSSAALQELDQNIKQVGRLHVVLRWPYLGDLGNLTHESPLQAPNMGIDHEVLEALWEFSTKMHNLMVEIDKIRRDAKGPIVIGPRQQSDWAEMFENTKASRTSLIELLFDRVREHGFTLPGKSDDW